MLLQIQKFWSGFDILELWTFVDRFFVTVNFWNISMFFKTFFWTGPDFDSDCQIEADLLSNGLPQKKCELDADHVQKQNKKVLLGCSSTLKCQKKTGG